MKNIRNLTVIFILAMLVGLGLSALGTVRAAAQDCNISINKSASPANNTQFGFSVTGDDTFGFILSDPGNTGTGFGINVGQTVTVTEETLPGWTLESIECTQGTSNCGMIDFVPCLTATVDGSSVTFFCDDDDTASCTFNNVRNPGQIPTLSEWGLISMAGIIGIAGFIAVMRRRKAAA